MYKTCKTPTYSFVSWMYLFFFFLINVFLGCILCLKINLHSVRYQFFFISKKQYIDKKEPRGSKEYTGRVQEGTKRKQTKTTPSKKLQKPTGPKNKPKNPTHSLTRSKNPKNNPCYQHYTNFSKSTSCSGS